MIRFRFYNRQVDVTVNNFPAVEKTNIQKRILTQRYPEKSRKLLIVTLAWLKSHKLLASGNKMSRLNSYGATWLVLEYLLAKEMLQSDFMDVFSEFAGFTADRLKKSKENQVPIVIDCDVGVRKEVGEGLMGHSGFGLVDPVDSEHNIAGNMNGKFVDLLKFVVKLMKVIKKNTIHKENMKRQMHANRTPTQAKSHANQTTPTFIISKYSRN